MLPFFYIDASLNEGAVIEPGEDTARHIVQVLRMREGEQLIFTDGRGRSAVCSIITTSKRSCTLKVGVVTVTPPRKYHITIAVSLLKNANRFEWFLEKATELGISRIVPLLCARTERQHFRKDRAEAIIISAMQQSQQSWLTELADPIDATAFISQRHEVDRYVAHCMEGEKLPITAIPAADALVLIGPEGDFTPEEVAAALQNGFIPVSLGSTRLRTETAAMAAAVALSLRS